MEAELPKNVTSVSRLQPMSGTVVENLVRLDSIYDSLDNLVHLKFDQNWRIPRLVFKVLGLIIQFYQHLTMITINRGLDKYLVHELNNLLRSSNITDVCLDNTFIEEANYHILLNEPTNLRYLSLARCGIPDNVIKDIADKIVYPLPPSKTLCILNLSSNRITDVGAGYIAEALRSNRQLYYLNLADNMIGDDGGLALLKSLVEFEVTDYELYNVRRSYMVYLKEKTALVQQMLKEIRAAEFEKKIAMKRKQSKATPITPKKKGLEKESSLRSVQETLLKSQANIESIWYEKASAMAETSIGAFSHPFGINNTVAKGDKIYCSGNYTLCYLNLAYNNLSYITLKRLVDVMKAQKIANRKPKGLINVPIEGNQLPISCAELAKIDEIIELTLMQERKLSATKKKPPKSGKSTG